jgi:hypothetical protein
MMYSCPDCKDGSLEAKVRELDLALEEGETAKIVGGRILITSVGCDNGCSSEVHKPRRKKNRSAPSAEPGQCPRSELCSKGPGHTGRCNSKLAEKNEG